MDYEFIKSRLSPCGLNCGKCFAFIEGDIKEYSSKLQNALGNFDIYAERFSKLLNEPVFGKYQEFKEMLNHFTSVNCRGCREENCKLFKNCNVRKCSEEKKVDFCFECPEFPCNNTGFDEHLNKRSRDINMRMKETGVENYYNEIKDKPRY
jgi:hypothetical protein